MLFNSLNFAIFLPVVFLLYWFVVNKSLKSQNVLLLIASYFFYSCWDWRFLFLLIFSTFLDFISGIKIAESKNQRAKNFWFWLSISINLGFLGVFKYYNFFIESFSIAIANFGFHANPLFLNVLLPVGISFYTFHGLSYVIDVYKNRIEAEKNIVEYSLFVSFFPLLVAGPIERATHLLPQIKVNRIFDYNKAVDGLRQILWGLFKKIVIADQCAKYANEIFNNSPEYSGSTLLVGAIFFSFQIYGDFSGYSDIAIGTARLFGFDLLRNFAFPYFSRDIAEFWRRWHISLSTWFRDYLYIPLGGSKVGTLKKIRNTFIIFLVSGFWHGANWTFIIWGLLHAIYILPSIICETNRKNLDIVAGGKYLPSISEFFQVSLTFTLVVFAWIFFRANNLEHAFRYVSEIFSSSLFTLPKLNGRGGSDIKSLLVALIFFIIIEWLGKEEQFAIAKLGKIEKRFLRYAFYSAILFAIFWFSGEQQQFIYFQF